MVRRRRSKAEIQPLPRTKLVLPPHPHTALTRATETPKAALFQSMDPFGAPAAGPGALERRVVLAMIKRRAAAEGLPPSTCCYTFRATGDLDRGHPRGPRLRTGSRTPWSRAGSAQ